MALDPNRWRNRYDYGAATHVMALRPLMWIEAHVRFGLVQHLGSGLTREAWLTRDGRVLKLPTPCDELEGARQVARQMERELELIEARATPSGFAVARGEAVYIQGQLCILMEHVTPWADYVGRYVPFRFTSRWQGLGAAAIDPGASRYFPARPALKERQWGYDARNRMVCYDAGRE